jgi:hypothetical protein
VCGRRFFTIGGVSGLDTTPEGATLFGRTMELVALTAALFALGAFLGRDLSAGWGFAFFVVSFAPSSSACGLRVRQAPAPSPSCLPSAWPWE